MQGRQRCMLLSLRDHHLIAEMLGILLERGQLGQSAITHEESFQRGACFGVHARFDEVCQALALGDEHIADDGLQRRVPWPHDLSGFQEPKHLHQDEGRGHIASCQQRSHLDESWSVGFRPESAAEQFCDLSPLPIPLVLAQRPERYRVSREVALQQEFNVFSRDFLPVEVEEGLLCLEVADLEQTVQTLNWPFAPVSHRTLGLGHGKKLGALEVVEVRQAVKRGPLGFRQDGQPSAVVGARWSVGLQLASISG